MLNYVNIFIKAGKWATHFRLQEKVFDFQNKVQGSELEKALPSQNVQHAHPEDMGPVITVTNQPECFLQTS